MLFKIVDRFRGYKWRNSEIYWEKRYRRGGNSGSGSYGRLADFKARVLNEFVETYNVESVIEWGCGDGNQLSLSNYKEYIGLDVSKTAIKICSERFKDDINKRFIWSGEDGFANSFKAELAISLDVVYHLVEEDVFEKYIHDLFDSSIKYVCIYSTNSDESEGYSDHVKMREFTKYIEENIEGFELFSVVENEYPNNDEKNGDSSDANFYFYERLSCR